MTATGAPAAPVERHAGDRFDMVAIAVLVAGFVLRATLAGTKSLEGDEALHYLMVHQPSALAVYRESLTNAHPPLFFLFLYVWHLVGDSELWLRLPSVLGGTAACYMAFIWLRTRFGKAAGLAGVTLLAFSPALLTVSAEVRSYGLLLLWMATALYFLDRTFTTRAQRDAVCFGAALYLAIGTHYSAVWFTLAIAAYAGIRIARGELPRPLVRTWAGIQLGALGLFAFFMMTHISQLRGSGMEQEAMDTWLRRSYYDPGEESLLLFPVLRSVELFGYLFAQRDLGVLFALLFVAGLRFLPAGSWRDAGSKAPALAVLLLLPFVLNCAAALARLYPYGGTRHCVFLALPAAAGIGVLAGRVTGGRPSRAWWAALVVVIIVQLAAGARLLPPQHQSKPGMRTAVAYLRESIAPGHLLLVDYQTRVLLNYYFWRDQPGGVDEPRPGLFERRYGGYRVVWTLGWRLTPESLGAQLERMADVYGLRPGDRVWIARAGPEWDFYSEAATRLPQLDLTERRTFGTVISVARATIAGRPSGRATPDGSE